MSRTPTARTLASRQAKAVTRRALSLSGGARWGALQAGYLKHVVGDRNLSHKVISGISVGTVNGIEICQWPLTMSRDEARKAADGLVDKWLKLRTKDIRRSLLGSLVRFTFLRGGIYDASPMWRYIRAGFDEKLFHASEREAYFGTVNVTKNRYELATNTSSDFFDRAVASALFPMGFPPKKIAGDYHSDGGLRHVTPLRAALSSGATEIDVMLTFAPERDENWQGSLFLPFLGLRYVDIMAESIERSDLKCCEAWNIAIKAGTTDPKAEGKRLVKLNIFQPKERLPDVSSLDFDPEVSKVLIDQGYEIAQEVMG